MINKFSEWSKRKYTKKQKMLGLILGELLLPVVIPLVFNYGGIPYRCRVGYAETHSKAA